MMSQATLDDVGAPDEDSLQHDTSENLRRRPGYDSISSAIDRAIENLDLADARAD